MSQHLSHGGLVPSIALRRLAVASSLIALLAAPSAAAAKAGPVIKSFPVALAWSLAQQGLDPAGSNDFNCKPTAKHPRPVVLLHGTYANKYNSFAALGPAIKRQGYCVFAVDYGKGMIKGVNGATAIRKSSREIAPFIEKVLVNTGASQVDIVGYSQGGLVARSYMLYDGGSNPQHPELNKVHSLVGLAVPNHGTDLNGATKEIKRYNFTPLYRIIAGDAAADLFDFSGFMKELNVDPGSETVPGVSYTMIASRADEISQPYTRAFLTAGPGATVKNITLSEGCYQDGSDHFNIGYSPRATAHVLKALDPAFGGRIPCTWQAPFL